MSSLPTTPEAVENPLLRDPNFRHIALNANFQPEHEQREAANHVLNFFRGSEGYPAGTFTQKLLSCMGSADAPNLRALANAFPLWGEAFVLGQQYPNGLEILRGRVAK